MAKAILFSEWAGAYEVKEVRPELVEVASKQLRLTNYRKSVKLQIIFFQLSVMACGVKKRTASSLPQVLSEVVFGMSKGGPLLLRFHSELFWENVRIRVGRGSEAHGLGRWRPPFLHPKVVYAPEGCLPR
jgi:hypothetical protein